MAESGKAFDLNNPPKSVADPGGPSGFQEFPKHLSHVDGSYCVVGSKVEETQALAGGCAGCAPKKKEKAGA